MHHGLRNVTGSIADRLKADLTVVVTGGDRLHGLQGLLEIPERAAHVANASTLLLR